MIKRAHISSLFLSLPTSAYLAELPDGYMPAPRETEADEKGEVRVHLDQIDSAAQKVWHATRVRVD